MAFVSVGVKKILIICGIIAVVLYTFPRRTPEKRRIWARQSQERSSIYLSLKSLGYNCLWNDPIDATEEREYDLCLCYNITTDHSEINDYQPSIEESRIRIRGSSRRLTFDDLAAIPDREWRRNFDKSVYRLYPLAIPVRDLVNQVVNGEDLSVEPIYNPLIRFLNIPSNICRDENITDPYLPYVILLYKSSVYNFDSREKIRRFYDLSKVKIPMKLMFTVGQPRTEGGNFFMRDGFNVSLQGRAGTKLLEHFLNSSKTTLMLSKEIEKFNDMLVGDYEDTYFNLSTKLFYTFQWSARFCRNYRPVFVFLDDDYAVSPSKLEAFLITKTKNQLDYLGHGYYQDFDPVHRPNSKRIQWALSKREIPWPKHMPEHLGAYSIWGYQHVHDMAIGMYFTKPIPIDDTWLALVQYKLGITHTTLKGMYVDVIQKISRNVKCADFTFAPIDEFIKRNCSL